MNLVGEHCIHTHTTIVAGSTGNGKSASELPVAQPGQKYHFVTVRFYPSYNFNTPPPTPQRGIALWQCPYFVS